MSGGGLLVGDRRTADRRVRRLSLHYPERRSGFDRRAPEGGLARRRHSALLAYGSRPALLAGCLAAVVGLNLVDLLLTLQALEGGATEVNPVMAGLLSIGPAPAAVFKLAVSIAVVVAVWMLRRYRRILELSLILAAGMSLLVVYQMVGLLALSG